MSRHRSRRTISLSGNIFNHGHNHVTLTDLDGVLCEDWRYNHEEGDLEERYLNHLDNARCLLRPPQHNSYSES